MKEIEIILKVSFFFLNFVKFKKYFFFFKGEPEIRQNRYDLFMESNFANRHKYDPFPSLNPFNNRTNVNTKSAAASSESRTSNQNAYNPFPSLNTAKPNISPDLYTNQFYMNSKFRRTKLW